MVMENRVQEPQWVKNQGHMDRLLASGFTHSLDEIVAEQGLLRHLGQPTNTSLLSCGRRLSLPECTILGRQLSRTLTAMSDNGVIADFSKIGGRINVLNSAYSFLSDVPAGEAFDLLERDGRIGYTFRSLEGLLAAVNDCSNKALRHHVSGNFGNDFANWVELSVKDRELAQKIRSINFGETLDELMSGRVKLVAAIQDRLSNAVRVTVPVGDNLLALDYHDANAVQEVVKQQADVIKGLLKHNLGFSQEACRAFDDGMKEHEQKKTIQAAIISNFTPTEQSRYRDLGVGHDPLEVFNVQSPELLYSPLWRMSQVCGRTDTQEQFFKVILPGLLRASRDRGKMPDRELYNLAILGDCIDESSNITPADTKSSSKAHSCDKHDLYSQVIQNPSGIHNFCRKRVRVIAHQLSHHAKYTCKSFLLALATNPEYYPRLTLYEDYAIPPETHLREMRKDIYTGLKRIETDIRHAVGQPDQIDDETAERIFVTQAEFLKNYSCVGLVRVANIYLGELQQIKDDGAQDQHEKVLETSVKRMNTIHDEMSNYSNVLLQAAYQIARERMDVKFGVPIAPTTTSERRCGFSVILFGGNARKDFPSFDYDILGVYEHEGQTTRGFPNEVYFKELMSYIGKAIELCDHSYGLETACFPSGVASLDGYRQYFNCADPMADPRFSPPMPRYDDTYARAHVDMALGAGDTVVAGEFKQMVNEIIAEPKSKEKIVECTCADRKRVHPTPDSIKHSVGGLRDIHIILWLDKVNQGYQENDVVKRLRLMSNRVLSEMETDYLVDSYHFLMNLRIRMDFHYLQNPKILPQGPERRALALSLGYKDHEGQKAEDCFYTDYQRHTHRVHQICESAIQRLVPKHIWEKVENELDPDRSLAQKFHSLTEAPVHRGPEPHRRRPEPGTSQRLPPE
jgi:hypothetical protein